MSQPQSHSNSHSSPSPIDSAAVLPVYQRAPIEVERGEGPYLFTPTGERYLDFISGVAVNCLGHAHPALIEALETQAKKVWQLSNLFHIPGMREFADDLISKTCADTAFFCNSGAEAIECCIKMVRKYHDAVGNPDRYRIITFEGAFHGRTLAAIWASKRDPMMQEGFGPPVEGFDNIPFGDIEAVKAAITPETGAVLIEPIQGDGGIRPAGKTFLTELRALCDEHGLLLCFDEIQSGMGRTGALYAHQYYDVKPDIFTSAKGIGGGFPLGACLATRNAAQGMTFGTHGSTYGGNPLAMAVGQKVLDIVSQEAFLENVTRISGILTQGLNDLAQRYPNVIAEGRGVGLLLGIQTVPNNKQCADILRQRGLLLAAAADNVLRLLPPLNIDEAVANEALDAIEWLCKNPPAS